jgi:NitT/TauT family transport system substrate-binding protein
MPSTMRQILKEPLRRGVSTILMAVAMLSAVAVTSSWAQTTKLRVGHFPNITHVQALVAHNLSRQGKGWFEQRLGPGIEIEWYVYNAGPSAMEAIFADTLDVTYVGPNPAINAYVKSKGTEIRVIAGAMNGGAALVVQPDLPLKAASDFKGRKIATPQLGNTQDIAARAWLAAGGLKITQMGGEAQVLPTANPDQLALFKSRQIDAVWTVEPWVSRLEGEAGGKVLVEESSAITTVLVSSAKLLASNRALVAKVVAAHRELTDWIKANPDEAQRLAREELLAITRAQVPAELVQKAWKRMVLTNETSTTAFETFLKAAQSVGFLRGTADLARLVETP